MLRNQIISLGRTHKVIQSQPVALHSHDQLSYLRQPIAAAVSLSINTVANIPVVHGYPLQILPSMKSISAVVNILNSMWSTSNVATEEFSPPWFRILATIVFMCITSQDAINFTLWRFTYNSFTKCRTSHFIEFKVSRVVLNGSLLQFYGVLY